MKDLLNCKTQMGIEENKRRMHWCWGGIGEGGDGVEEEWIGGVAFF